MLNQLKPEYPMKKGIRPDFKGAIKMFFVLLLITAAYPLHAAKYYWVGGAGNWTDLTHWASTSGGSEKYQSLPGIYDDVIFDANSGFAAGNNTVTLDSTGSCKSMNWTGATNTPVFTDGTADFTFNVHGDLTLVTGMTFDVNTLSFADLSNFPYGRTDRFRTVTLNGVALNSNVVIGGEDYIRFADNVNLGLNDLFLIGNGYGFIDFHGLTLNARNVYVNSWADIDIRNSNIICSEAFIVNTNPNIRGGGSTVTVSSGIDVPSNFQFDNVVVTGSPADPTQNVTVNVSQANFNSFTVNMAATWTGNMTINAGFGATTRDFSLTVANASNNVYFTGSWTVNSTAVINGTAGVIHLNNGSIDVTSGNLATIGAGTDLRIDPSNSFGASKLVLNGTATDSVRISSSSAGNSASFYAISGFHCLDFVTFTDIDATNGQNLNAPLTSDKGGNSGITFAATCGDTPEVFTTLDPSSLSICEGSQFTITFTYTGTPLTVANTFLLERSDDEGNWVGDIIDFKADSLPVVFTVNMPSLNYNASSNYRFRVRATELPGSGISTPNPSNVNVGYAPYVSTNVNNQNVEPGEVVYLNWEFDGLSPFTYTYTDGTSITTATTNERSIWDYTTSNVDRSYNVLSVLNSCGIGNASANFDVMMSAGLQNENPSFSMFGDTTICRQLNGGNDYVKVWASALNTTTPDDYTVYFESSEYPGSTYSFNLNNASDFSSEYPEVNSVAFKPLFAVNNNSGARYTDVSGLLTAVVNARPRADLSLAPNELATICQGSSATLQVDFTAGSAPWDVTYDAGGSPITVTGITSNPYFFSVNPYSSTDYDLSTNFASVTSGTCTSELNANNGLVSITVQTPATVSLLSGDSTISYCTSTNAADTFKLLLNIAGGAAPYSISINDGTSTFAIPGLVAGDTIIPMFPNANTVYTITGINSGGVCVGGMINAVPVTATVTPVAVLSATLTGAQTICSMTPAQLTIALSGSVPATMVINHGGILDTINNITTTPYYLYVAPTVSTAYNIVSIKNKCGLGTATGNISVAVDNTPVSASFNVIPQGNNTFRFVNTSTNANSYTWNFGDGTIFTSAVADTVYTYATAGIYQVTLTASNDCNAQSGTQTVSTATAVENALDMATVRVYPNPSKGLFNLEVSGVDQSVNVTVENLQGQVVFESVINGNGSTKELDIQNQSAGIYMLHLTTEQGRVVRKLIVQ